MLLRHLLRPFEAPPLLLLIVFTLGLRFGIHGGLFGIFIVLTLLSWFFKYAYVLLDAVANGAATPVLSVEMLNPADEQRPLAQLLICIVVGGFAWYLGGVPGWIVGVLGLLYLPASVAVLGASARAIDAVNPLALTRVIVGLGVYYLLALAIVAAYAIALFFLVRANVWEMLQIAFTLFAVLSIFSMLGGLLYERRHVLGLEPTHAPEREAERAERERSRERARALDEVYGAARAGNFMGARESLLAWLRQAGDRLESDVRYIFNEARTWPDEKAFVFVSRFLISHLIEAGRTGTIVEIVNGVLERAPALQLGTASDTLKIAHLARAAGRRALALRVLQSFERQFPGDARTAEVTALRKEMGQ